MRYDWLIALTQDVRNKYYLDLSPKGASQKEIAHLETELGVKLPDSYREFLKIWNGGEIRTSRILSVDELLDYAKEWGFEKFDTKIKIADKRQRHYYASRPAHQLIFRTFELSPVVFCLDTRYEQAGEYFIAQYDADENLEGHLKPIFPSFESMLIEEILQDICTDAESFLDWDNPENVDWIALEKKSIYWESQLQDLPRI
jgi:hypothetical protein